MTLVNQRKYLESKAQTALPSFATHNLCTYSGHCYTITISTAGKSNHTKYFLNIKKHFKYRIQTSSSEKSLIFFQVYPFYPPRLLLALHSIEWWYRSYISLPFFTQNLNSLNNNPPQKTAMDSYIFKIGFFSNFYLIDLLEATFSYDFSFFVTHEETEFLIGKI